MAEAAPPPGADKWALLIGINKHQGTTRTNVGGVGDTDDLKQARRHHRRRR